MNEINWSHRTNLLLQSSGVEALQKAHILLAGAGGVGGYAAEALIRAGVGEITVYDPDTVNLTNCNRQILALRSTLDQPKVEVLKQRALDIDPEVKFHGFASALTPGNITDILTGTRFDYVVDAIDSLSDKCFLLAECHRLQIPVIAAMGAAGRMDPTRLQYADISRTNNCRLAKQVRSNLRKMGIYKGIKCVFSDEDVPSSAILPPDENNHRSTVGSISYLPAIFGLYLAAEVIRALTQTT